MADGQHCTSRVRPEQDPMECKIDKLHDELLVAILSYLSVIEAAKTSLVSRRWRYLWQYTTGCLEIFDRDKRTKVSGGPYMFVMLVNQVLKLHQCPTLDQFRVGFSNYDSWFTIDHWVKFAIQKEVKLFELNLGVDDGWERRVGWDQYKFPNIERLSSGDTGKLKFSRFCSNLKSLTLVNVNVKEEIIHFFLSNCPYLEEVRVSYSKGLRNLKVTGTLPNLKSMEISWCSSVESLEVDASNLEYFTYIGPDILVPFRNVPQLSELTVGEGYCYSFIYKADKHISYSYKLRKLKLMVFVENLVFYWSPYTFIYPENFPMLYNLRELELDLESDAGRSLLFFSLFFIKTSPSLSSFTARITYTKILAKEIMAYCCQPAHTARLADGFVHKHLKVAKLIGFTGCISDFELALCLLEIGGSLEEIILQPINNSLHHGINEKQDQAT